MRIVCAFAASLVVGWSMGILLTDVPRAWPLAAAMVLAGFALPIASRLGGPAATGRASPAREVQERR